MLSCLVPRNKWEGLTQGRSSANLLFPPKHLVRRVVAAAHHPLVISQRRLAAHWHSAELQERLVIALGVRHSPPQFLRLCLGDSLAFVPGVASRVDARAEAE